MRHLYKILAIFLLVVCSTSLFAQVRTVTFTGRDRTNQYHIPLSQVTVFNLDQLWEEVLYYPDTVLVLGSMDVEDYETGQNLQLMQNVPNPFDGTTEFALQLPENRDVLLEIYDITGKLAVGQRFSALSAGTHLFQATLASPQTYLLSAKVDHGQMTIKMVNNGYGEGNTIRHLGMTDKNGDFTIYLKNDQAYSGYPFHVGDEMKYIGFAMIDEIMMESSTIIVRQYDNETIPLLFDVTVPTVTTRITSVSATSADGGGFVTNSGGSPVTMRGICWSTTQNPTLADNHTDDGSGTGSFNSTMTDLTPNTTYYLRAYATNSVGTGYGEQRTFTTPCDPMNVSITGNTAINYGQSTTLTASGAYNYQWSTGATTSSITVSPTTTTAYTVTGINVYGCTATASITVTVNPILPMVTTNDVVNISESSATCGGNVTSHGGAAVTARGVCWSTSQNPTIIDNRTTDGSGTGTFTSSLTGLTPNTTYYVRAYATNIVGTSYGEEMSFTTPCNVVNVSITGNTIVNYGQTTTLTASGAYNYQWSTGATTASITVYPTTTPTTMYTVTGTNSYGCTATASVTVTVNPVAPTVTTNNVSNIQATSATCGGNVTSHGGSAVMARGVCWGTSQNPTVNNSHTTNGSGTGTFTSSLTGLLPNTTYYVRAYATNSVGTMYGEQKSFTTPCNVVSVSIAGITTINYGQSTTLTASGAISYYWSTNATTANITVSPATTTTYTVTGTNAYGCTATASKTVTVNPILPTVTTNDVANITENSASCGGNVTSHGGATVTARGVCWSTSPNPTVNNSHTSNGSGTGSFSSSITGLNPNTTYYVRAYATNSVGTSYGEEKSFTTPCNVLSVSIAGSTVINYGQNTTLSATGANSYLWSTNATTASITVSPTSTTTYTVTGTNSYGCTTTASVTVTVNPIAPTVTTNDVANITETSAICGGNVTSDGGAAVTARGVCWSILQNPTVADNHTTNGTGIGGFSSSITGLNPNTTYYVRAYAINSVDTVYGAQKTFTTQCNTVTVNISGNTTIDYGQDATLTASGANSYRWSNNFTTASITVSPTSTTTYTVTGTNSYGCTATTSVTVIVNPIAPMVITSDVTNIQSYSASCGGNVISDGGATVTERGVCWSTSQNPTIIDSHTADGNGMGTFTSNLTGLIPNTIYYVRAYATNRVEIVYGEQKQFKTSCVAMSVNIIGNTTIDYGQSTTLTASGADNYQWSTNATTASITVSPTSTTTYTVTGTNSNGCSATASVTVTVNFLAPTVTTNNVTDVSQMSAICGGNVTFDGGKAVTARGVCWSTSPNPTVSNSHTEDGNGLGTFASSITGLNPNTMYYVRAYAINSVGTAYGVQKTFTTSCNTVTVSVSGNTIIDYGQSTTLTASGANSYRWSNNATTTNITVSPTSTTTYTVTGTNSYGCTATASVTVTVNPIAPTVTTNMVSNIDSVSALCGGNVTSDGGATVTERGVCWSTSPNPTVSGSHTTAGTGNGAFTSSITGLMPNTTYYVRAYAINSVDTAYGAQQSFVTIVPDGDPCPGTPTVSDIDGNTYNTVKIGQQCWMKENLRTTKYADGTNIPAGGDNNSFTLPYYYDYGNSNYGNSNIPLAERGLLYNWPAVMHGANSSEGNPSNVQGVCPVGWHVPSDAEWTQLTDYVSSQSEYLCDDNNTRIAKALAATNRWDSGSTTCSVGYNQTSNNATGFSAIPSGQYNAYGSWFTNSRYGTYFWSATDTSYFEAWIRCLIATDVKVYHSSKDKNNGCSVRCLRDSIVTEVQLSLPIVTSDSATLVNSSSAYSGGNVISGGGGIVTDRGVCWSISQNPTIDNNHYSSGRGGGAFTTIITGLSPSTTYYVRAYATNDAGTAYGEQRSFTTMASENTLCPGTIADIDGNIYTTVRIGGQCWMRENLRTTKYADGTDIIQENSGYDTSSVGWYYRSGDFLNNPYLGLEYNWSAVMHGAASSDATPSGVQGICPDGWHVPSDAEWTQLFQYVGNQSQYLCDNNSNNIAKALASSTGWNYSANTCAVGNMPSNNNSTGFSALPNYNDDSRHYAYFWSATKTSGSEPKIRYLVSDFEGVCSNIILNGYSCPVRCLFNEDQSQYFPSVSTNAVNSVTSTTAVCGGTVTSTGIVSVTDRGVCWSILHNPTIAENHAPNGSGTGSFTGSISGLSTNTTYYLRAYATTIYGTVYGNEVQFTTPVNFSGDEYSCPNAPVLTDADGNIYNTLLLGGQCWMRENLRTTKYANGFSVAQGNMQGIDYSDTTGYWYYPVNDSSNKYTYGLLYNWYAVMNGSSSSTTNPSGVQGICPTGWHVPSPAEWSQLTDYVSSQSQYWCGGDSNNIAKALASTAGWFMNDRYAQECSASNIPGNNNATGFGVLPAGAFFGDEFNNYAYEALYWSSTQYDDDYACYWGFAYMQSRFFGDNISRWNKKYGFSVRCLCDAATAVIDSKSCPAAPTVTDHEGNVYATVQIGYQCWMRDNLRTTTSPSTGTYLIPPAGTGYTYTGKQARWYNNDSTTYAPMNYGLLYNWNAAVDTFNTAYGETSLNTSSGNAVNVSFSGNRRGICPAGWHLPSDAEWVVMTINVGGQSEYWCDSTANYIAKALADSTGWDSSTNTCAVGNDQSRNNATGFSALPAGCYSGNSYYDSGYFAEFWSATKSSSSRAYYRPLYFGFADVYGSDNVKSSGYSVRCLRDETYSTVIDSKSCPAAPTVTDIDGNVYSTVQIGGQCWTRENLRVTHYTDGTEISVGGDTSLINPYYYNVTDLSIPVAQRGYLYNWPAVMHGANSCSTNPSSVQGICPIGWHVPSDEEWMTLTNYVSGQSEYVCDSNSSYIAKALANTSYWRSSDDTCDEGNNQSSNNATGFSVLPVGGHAKNGYFFAFGAYFWSATESSNVQAYYRSLGGFATVNRYSSDKYNGFSVRCLRDAGIAVVDEKSCPAAPTVTDHEGNVYATVQIGDQCWMRDNLRTTTSPSTGTYLIPPVGISNTTTGKQARWYNDDSTTYAQMNYGLLYNWYAAVDTFNTMYGETSVNTSSSNHVSMYFTGNRRGICPEGWHLPSDADWTQLTTYVGSQSEYTCESNNTYIAKALADSKGWYTNTNICAVGNNQSGNNTTGFGALPAGAHLNDGSYASGYDAILWSATGYDSWYAYYRSLYHYTASVSRNYGGKSNGYSVRCLRDAGTAVIDSKSCPAAPTVTDHEGNVYATVQIGNQCWMRDNLRTTTSPSTGTYLIPTAGTTYTCTGKQARWYNNDSTTYAPMNYGLLYNWNAAVDTFNTAYGETSVNTSSSNTVSVSFMGNRRGICPAGWHLPSDAEWTAMTDSVKSQSEYTCGGSSNYIAKALASETGWNSYSGECYPGDQSVYANNATDFSAVPTGYCNGSSFNNASNNAIFWSSSQNESNSYNAYGRNLQYKYAYVGRYDIYKRHGFSVRCLRD